MLSGPTNIVQFTPDLAYGSICGPEIVAPLRDAMGLIYSDQINTWGLQFINNDLNIT